MQLVSARSLVAAPLALVLIAAPALAESKRAVDAPVWEPPEAGSEQMDWIRLETGETLYGDFEGLRDREVYFDSDTFGNLDFKWRKVASVYLTAPKIFRLNDRSVTGTAEMREDVVRVRTSSGEVIEFMRSQLVSITKGGEEENSYWSGDVGVAFSAREGNTDQVDVSGHVHVKRETEFTRWIGDYRGIYGELEGDENIQNHRAFTKFDVYLTRRFYFTAPSIEYFRAEFQNIEARVTPGLALGYEFVKNGQVEWDASLGGSYQYTEFFEGSDGDHDFAVVGETVLEIDVTSDIEIDSLYKVAIVVTDLDKTNHHFESELSNDIWGPVELDLTLIWDRNEKPVADEDGDRPKSDDFRIMLGFSAGF